jgi:ribonuclease Z
MIQAVLLGTSCMVPTKERNVTGIYVDYKGEGMLFDCGEGTQRQMNIANINRNKVKHIFISHWHGDHVAGIIGLIQTVSNSNPSGIMNIYGPVETKKRIQHLLDSVYFDNSLELRITELDPKKLEVCYENDSFKIKCIHLDHGIPCIGYALVEKDRRRITTSKVKKLNIPDGPLLGKLQQGKDVVFDGKKLKAEELTYIVKGKKLAIVMDTGYTQNAITLAENADCVISEATYGHDYAEKAEARKHLTVREAAQIATNANAKKLVMIHFSQRYKQTKDIEEEARAIFPETYAGFDFMKIKL